MFLFDSIRPFVSNLTFIKDADQYYIYRCPFCGDSSNPSHGHLYINKRKPYAFCFKCGYHPFKEIEDQIGEKCRCQYDTSEEQKIPVFHPKDMIDEVTETIQMHFSEMSAEEKAYFCKRTNLPSLTLEDAIKFNLLPDSYCKDMLFKTNSLKYRWIANSSNKRTWTVRGLGTGLSGRAINPEDGYRYANGSLTPFYNDDVAIDNYFVKSSCIENFNPNNPPRNLVVCEGVYDCVPLYLKCRMYGINEKETLFVAVQCSEYIRGVKLYKFLYNTLPDHIYLFVDSNITSITIKKQFKSILLSKNNKITITIKWPMKKDWEDTLPAKISIDVKSINDLAIGNDTSYSSNRSSFKSKNNHYRSSTNRWDSQFMQTQRRKNFPPKSSPLFFGNSS